MSPLVFGVDAASYNGHVNWAAVDQGCAFGFEKVTQGTDYVNPYWAAAKPAMLARREATGFVPGAYLFLDASPGMPQADYFAAVAGNLDGFAIAIDVERGSGDPTRGEAQRAVARLRHHYPGHKVIGYIPHWFWGGQDTTFVDVLWASSYVSGSGSPRELYAGTWPSQWDGYGGRAPDLLQFTSSAVVPGVAGRVDCSAFRGGPAELRAALGVPAPTNAAPVPPPAPERLSGYTVWQDQGGALKARSTTSTDGSITWK